MLNFLDLDDNCGSILCYISTHGPVTMYKVARELSLHFSYVYRKASRLENAGLLKRVSTHRSNLYDATLNGLIYSYVSGCNREMVITKITRYLGLDVFTREEVESFLKFYLSIADRDAPLSNLVVMISYVLERCGRDLCRNHPVPPLAARVIAYGVIQMVQRHFGNTIILVDENYYAIIDSARGEIMAVQCKLCGRDKYCSYEVCSTLENAIKLRLKKFQPSRLTPLQRL